jgi:hypothetical protein
VVDGLGMSFGLYLNDEGGRCDGGDADFRGDVDDGGGDLHDARDSRHDQVYVDALKILVDPDFYLRNPCRGAWSAVRYLKRSLDFRDEPSMIPKTCWSCCCCCHSRYCVYCCDAFDDDDDVDGAGDNNFENYDVVHECY